MFSKFVTSFKRIFPKQADKQKFGDDKHLLSKEIDSELNIFKTQINEFFGKASDFVSRDFRIGGNVNLPATVCFIEGLVDKKIINESILQPLMEGGMIQVKGFPLNSEAVKEIIKQKLLTIGETKDVNDYGQLLQGILTGNTAIFLEGCSTVIIANTKGWQQRAISEPVTESVVRGPREGFNETLRTNTSLLRRKIKSHKFRFESMMIGKLSETEVVLAYMDGIADPKVVEEAKTRLKRIEIDGIMESGYIEELIEDSPFSPFPQLEHSERPDKVASAILEGRVALLIDGSPYALMIPTLFVQFFQSSEDYYERYYFGSAIRLIRLASFFIALLLPSVYIAVTTIHQEMIPTPLALSVAGAREGVPFPAFVEAILMELSFELLREAGIRLPQPVGQALSIVGALVIGEAAVQAGIVSPAMVIIVSLTGIASFSLPAYSFVIALRLLRFPMMIAGAALGLPGIIIGLLIMLTHLASLRSFGIPYLSPLAPSSFGDLKDVLVRVPWWHMILRPRMLGYSKPQRQAFRQKPGPQKGRGGK